MPKRKIRQSQKLTEDEVESRKLTEQFKNLLNNSKASAKNITPSKNKNDSILDSDFNDLGETSDTGANETEYDSFTSFLKAYSYRVDESEDEPSVSKGASGIASNECEKSANDSKGGKLHEEMPHASSSSHENTLNEGSETNIRILSAPSKSSQVVLMQHPASVTLHGYVRVTVWCGSVHIFGYHLKEGQSAVVLSTEGTGLKRAATSRPKRKIDVEKLEKALGKLTYLEKLDLEPFMNEVEPVSIVICVEKVLLPPNLQVLELYYPTALQTRWFRSEAAQRDKGLKLCSTEEAYTVDIKGAFKKLSKHVNEVISNPDCTEFGPRIIVRGEKNMGKSTLIRYLMNSALNKVDEVYFLDTDPGQTEYTPPGVVSLLRVTKPLLGPPFAHQKTPLKMIFVGSVTPGYCPMLYKESVMFLMKYFNEKILKISAKTQMTEVRIPGIDSSHQKKALFVNTIGWVQGVGELCLQSVKEAVKPTMQIELIAPGADVELSRDVDENGVVIFTVPSKAPPRKSGAPSYSPVEMRNFNIVSYFGLCKKPYSDLTYINSFQPMCVGWDQIPLYVMGKKVPPHRLVEAIHFSIVALCHVELSSVLKSDISGLPMTLKDEQICECLGFGLVRASNEKERLYYIITPLSLDQLMNVNALIKGNITIPEEVILKQPIKGVNLPFTSQSQAAKTPGLKAVPKRAFRNTRTPKKR